MTAIKRTTFRAPFDETRRPLRHSAAFVNEQQQHASWPRPRLDRSRCGRCSTVRQLPRMHLLCQKLFGGRRKASRCCFSAERVRFFSWGPGETPQRWWSDSLHLTGANRSTFPLRWGGAGANRSTCWCESLHLLVRIAPPGGAIRSPSVEGVVASRESSVFSARKGELP
jgi:hypothetical protein